MISENETMKSCTKCKREKTLDAFGGDRSKKDGRKSRCKECDAAQKRKAYAKSPKVRSNRVVQQRHRRWRDIAQEHGERWLIEQVQTLKRTGRLAGDASHRAEHDDRLAAFFREARKTSSERLRKHLGSRLWDRVERPFVPKKVREEAAKESRERMWAKLNAMNGADIVAVDWDDDLGRRTPVYDIDDGPSFANYLEREASDRILREGRFEPERPEKD